MVSSTSAYADKFSSNVTSNEKSVDTTIRLISDTPTATENEHDGLSLIREGFKHAGIPTRTQDIMFKSISKNGLCLQIDNLLIPCDHL